MLVHFSTSIVSHDNFMFQRKFDMKSRGGLVFRSINVIRCRFLALAVLASCFTGRIEANDLDTLRSVSASIEGNISKIKTFRGSYVLEVTPKVSTAPNQNGHKNIERGGSSKSICTFVVNAESGDLFSENLKSKDVDAISSNLDISLAEVSFRQRSSVLGSVFMYCVDGTHADTPEANSAEDTKSARLTLIIEPESRAEAFLSSSLLCNPLGFFHSNPRQPITSLIDLFIENVDKRPIKVEEIGGRVVLFDESGALKNRFDFDLNSSGNLIRYEAVRNGLRYAFHEVKYRESEGIFLPWEVIHENYNGDGTLARRRVFTARELEVNFPLDDSSFGLAAFGLPNGSIVVNRIENSESLVWNGEVVTEESYVNLSKRTELPIGSGFFSRRVLVFANLSFFVLLCLYWFWRSKKRA